MLLRVLQLSQTTSVTIQMVFVPEIELNFPSRLVLFIYSMQIYKSYKGWEAHLFFLPH